MHIGGIIFDVNGTLVDIHTDEGRPRVYRALSHFLTYQGIHVHRSVIQDEYHHILREQRHASGQAHPEFDAPSVWREFLRRRGGHLPPDKAHILPLMLAELFRGVSRQRLTLYPSVREVLDHLRCHHRLAVISDGQSAWARPEMRAVGIEHYFDPIVVSGDHGFRKPDRRLFEMALHRLGIPPWEAIYVGNDMYRDVHGPSQLGIKTVYFDSNQGRKHHDGAAPDYIIRHFGELPRAIEFLRHNH